MHDAPVDRSRGGGERLTEHLAAEDLGAADIAALAAKKIHLEGLELEELQQIRELRVHCLPGAKSASPRCAASRSARIISRPRGAALGRFTACFCTQSGTPSRWCMMGLVVVYCRNWRFCGKRWCWMAKAASAAS